MPVLIMPEPVSQIDVLEDHGLVVFLSGHRIMIVPFSILSTANPRDSTSCTRVSSHATFSKIGVCSGRHLVCVVKAGLSTTCELFQPLVSRPTPTVPPTTRSFNLQPYKEFYVSERVTSIHFLRTKSVAGTSRHDFEVIDVDSLVTQPLFIVQSVGGQVLTRVQGRILGGNSSINGMRWTRGAIEHWNDLELSGNVQYSEVHELHWFDGDVDAGLPQPPSEATVAAQKVEDALRAAIPGLADILGVPSGTQDGVAGVQFSIKLGNITAATPCGNTEHGSVNAHIYPLNCTGENL